MFTDFRWNPKLLQRHLDLLYNDPSLVCHKSHKPLRHCPTEPLTPVVGDVDIPIIRVKGLTGNRVLITIPSSTAQVNVGGPTRNPSITSERDCFLVIVTPIDGGLYKRQRVYSNSIK